MLLLLGVAASGLSAQARQRATGPTPFHKDPRGIQLGTLVQGGEYAIGSTQGTWVEATVVGWIWGQSVQPTTRDGFDLTVSAAGGEVVRASPNGAVVARLVPGTLLRRVGERGAWVQVSRTGWVSRSALATAPTPAPAPAPPAVVPGAPPARAPEASLDSVRLQSPLPPVQTPAADSTGPAVPRVTVRRGTELATAPDGERVASFSKIGEAEVVERSRDWVRVRVEGWVRAQDLGGAAADRPAITAAMVREQPDRYLGQTVSWRIQFLAHQQADDLRPELPKGQPYLLARGPLPEVGFVYVSVSPQQAAELRGLKPLDEIRIEGVLRAARTRYLPTPVVELVRVTELR